MRELTKPLGTKAYGHIPHLPGSRLGPGDHCCHDGQARICTEKVRDKHDVIIVTEKLDGSNVCVARINGQCYALTRSGYLAMSSPYRQHHMFARWVYSNYERFLAVLEDGERLVGEWLAQAHATRYEIEAEPFVAFDLMKGKERLVTEDVITRLALGEFIYPYIIHTGGPISIKDAMQKLGKGYHGAIDPVEGAVWRVERCGKVDFLAKYVVPGKVDGRYLPEVSGNEAVWNWRKD